MSSLQYLEVVFCFLSLTELTRFLLSFVLWSFQVLGEFLWWIMEQGVEKPKLGDAHGTPKIIQGHQKVKAWGCPGRHPLFRLLPSVTLLGAIFLFATWYVFCLERLVLFASLLVSLPQSSLMYTSFEIAIHDIEFDRILYVLRLYLLSLLVLLIVLHLYLLSVIIFALVLHLYILEHGGGFVL